MTRIALTTSLSSTAGNAGEASVVAFKDADSLLQAGKGRGIELTSIPSCASTGRWGFLCQRSAIVDLLLYLCRPVNSVIEGDSLQV